MRGRSIAKMILARSSLLLSETCETRQREDGREFHLRNFAGPSNLETWSKKGRALWSWWVMAQL